MGGACGDVAGETVVGGWALNALSDISLAGEGAGAVAFDEIAAAFDLGEQRHIPDGTVVAGELEKRAVGLVAAR